MKYLVATIFCCCCFFSVSIGQGCREDCNDFAKNCPSLATLCSTSTQVQSLCPLSCRTCVQCRSQRAPPPNCEMGTCHDVSGPILCQIFTKRVMGCVIFARYCRATCGHCRGCLLPPKEIECTHDCVNQHGSCDYWKSKGFCAAKKGFPHTINVCPLACGICVPCPTEEPNTALPPTKEEELFNSLNSTKFVVVG